MANDTALFALLFACALQAGGAEKIPSHPLVAIFGQSFIQFLRIALAGDAASLFFHANESSS